MQVGFGNFEVVAEDGIELHLQRTDPSALSLALFDLGQIKLAVAAEIAQFVKFRIDAGGDDTSIIQRERRLGNEGRGDLLAQVREFIDGLANFTLRDSANSVADSIAESSAALKETGAE